MHTPPFLFVVLNAVHCEHVVTLALVVVPSAAIWHALHCAPMTITLGYQDNEDITGYLLVLTSLHVC